MESQEKLKKQITTSWKFALYMLKGLPMGFIAGLRIAHLDKEKCIATVPFKYLTKNPFKSSYFAVQAMAAELSTATGCLLAVAGTKPSVAFIIVDMKATFAKKAISKVFFECLDVKNGFDAVEKAISTGEAQVATFKTIGRMADGTIVSEFEFSWSFKQRSS